MVRPARHDHTPKKRNVISIEEDILGKNNRLASFNRALFRDKGIFVLNLVSSPGSGKTMLARRLAVASDPAERATLRLRLAAAMEAAEDTTSLLGMADLAAREAPTYLPAVRAARQAAGIRK